MGTRLPWCAVLFLAACHAGPGDFPGTYGQPRFVATMKVVGCGLLIDGFGRKAVSFTPLKTIGPHYVKVDGSIVRKVLTSEVARTGTTSSGPTTAPAIWDRICAICAGVFPVMPAG